MTSLKLLMVLTLTALASCRSYYNPENLGKKIIPVKKPRIKRGWTCNPNVETGPYIVFKGNFQYNTVQISVNDSIVYNKKLTKILYLKDVSHFNVKEMPDEGKLLIKIDDGEWNKINFPQKHCFMVIKKRKSRVKFVVTSSYGHNRGLKI